MLSCFVRMRVYFITNCYTRYGTCTSRGFTVLRRLTPFDTTRFWVTVTHIVDSAHDMYAPLPPFPRFRSFMKLETNDRGELEFEGFMRFCTTTLKTAAKNQRLKADSVASEADVDGANA